MGQVADDGSTVDWITSLRSQTIRKLMNEGPLQLPQFDERKEIIYPDVSDPPLVADRARTREELLTATEGGWRRFTGKA